jgi:molybdopterin/thiamine biosynthesis adenylyltransferase
VSVTPASEPQEWYQTSPQRLEWELAEFAARGLPAQAEVASTGRMRITTSLPFDGEPVEILVIFPFEYPDVEPTVYGPPGLVGRHQTRVVGNFCLIEDPRLDWWPTMSAAGLVDEDLRWLLEDSAAGATAVAGGEADMPEPLSQHIAVDHSVVVVVPDPFWAIELDAGHGRLVLAEAFLSNSLVVTEADGIGHGEAAALDVVTNAKKARHAALWVALGVGALPLWPSHVELLDIGLAAWPELLGKLRETLKRERKRASVSGFVGVTFLEEGPRRGDTRRGWIFLDVELDRKGERSVLRALRAQALTPAERARRVPELVGLAEARVAVVGAGSLGAPITSELVKAGVGHTDLLDYDRFDVNNCVRHLIGPRWAGVEKEIAVAIETETLNPFVKVAARHIHVGGGQDDQSRLGLILPEVDLVVDATGSHSAARVLQRRCRDHGKTLVLASLTAGSYGGEVAVFRPDGPCFWCFVLGQRDGSVPSPAEGPRSNTTPVGCSTPAFSGAGFDATALAALAARTVVQACGRTSYPSLESDYIIVNFRGPNPWRQGNLQVHPECPLAH